MQRTARVLPLVLVLLVPGRIVRANCTDLAAAIRVRGLATTACPCGQATSHGAYVSCVRRVVAAALKAGTLPHQCKRSVARCAVRSGQPQREVPVAASSRQRFTE